LNLIDAEPQQRALTTASSLDGAEYGRTPWPPDRIARWQRDHLSAIHGVLPPTWEARFQALVAEYGPAEDPTALNRTVRFSRVREESPVTAGDLAAMSTDALAEFVRTWEPSTTTWPPLSHESLSGALTTAVRDDAARRSTDAALFIGLPPVFVSAVLNGLWQAATNGTVLEWDGIVTLVEWINQEAIAELDAPSPGAGRRWQVPRIDMLRVLVLGLDSRSEPMPVALDTRVWAVLASCCEDPDPPAGDEGVDSSPDWDQLLRMPDTSVRSQAIYTAICYGLWRRRTEIDPELDHLQTVLDRHLDQWHDSSRAVRSVYGYLFAQLLWMSPDWARARAGSLFPLDPPQSMLLTAAWDGYLASGNITDWELLFDVYDAMVERVGTTSNDKIETLRSTELGLHLLNRLWAGQLSLDSHRGILRRFYARVSSNIATDLQRSIGDHLTDDAIAPGVAERLIAFWEFRVSAVRNADTAARSELAEFGRWFAAGHFDPAWSLRQLLVALSLAEQIEDSSEVLEKLAELAPDYAQQCLTVVDRWLDSQPDPWRLMTTEQSLHRIVTAGLAGDATAVDTAMRVVSQLLGDYGIDLRDLLPRDSA
jgi:hypothetical protein